MKKFVLIDGNSLLNRAFYATPILTNSKGVATNAVYSFINMLLKIINEIKPDYILVAYDRKEPTFRHSLYSEYKGTRKPAPKELHEQIELSKKVLDEMNIARFEKPSIEADDIIGTLAKKYKDVKSIIFTGDKDSFQLVDQSTSVYFTKRGITDTEIYSVDNFKEKTQLNPEQIIDLKALMGDSSDNIPGVSGVGEKTAKTLINTYESVENLYEHIDEISGKLKDKLIEGKDSCFLSKVLATINTEVEIDLDLKDYEYDFPFSNGFKELAKELELKSLLKKSDIFQEEIYEFKSVEIFEINDVKEITSFIKNDIISLTIGDFIDFYNLDNKENRFNVQQDLLSIFGKDEALISLKPFFENSKNTVIVYYSNQLKHSLKDLGIDVKAKIIDVSLMKYLVDYSGEDAPLQDAISDNNLDVNIPAFSLYELYNKYSKMLTDDELWLYENIDLPLSDVLFDMENAGFKVDVNALNKMGDELNIKIDSIKEKIFQIAGKEFNINSTRQLSQILFEDLGLKHGKKTKIGYSTNANILNKLKGEHEIIDLILDYRKYFKMLSTYINGYKKQISPVTGLVHTTFNQVHTATGRLSSREPNLQNIPVRDELGKEIRKLFFARDDDHILIDADYSQIELRLLAHFSKSKTLIDAFNNDIDIHSVTASQVFNVPLNSVTPKMRSSAKAVNFGIIYGISDFGLSENLKISPSVAGEYIKKYFEMYPNVKEYMNNNVEFARKNGYAVTLFKRKRYIRDINSSNYNLRSFAERVAMNMPLQGTASDIIKIAMINVYKRLKSRNLQSKLILQVHDELIIDALKSEAQEVKNILIEEMQNAVKLDVKLTVSVSVCENWFDAK